MSNPAQSKFGTYRDAWEARKIIYGEAIRDLFKERTMNMEPTSLPDKNNPVELKKNPFTQPEAGTYCAGASASKPQVEDNWIHRSAGMQCHTCMWYVSKTGGKGRCRRHAPTLGGWPVLFPSDWCGDHKLA